MPILIAVPLSFLIGAILSYAFRGAEIKAHIALNKELLGEYIKLSQQFKNEVVLLEKKIASLL
jgi:hypothetical protein